MQINNCDGENFYKGLDNLSSRKINYLELPLLPMLKLQFGIHVLSFRLFQIHLC